MIRTNVNVATDKTDDSKSPANQNTNTPNTSDSERVKQAMEEWMAAGGQQYFANYLLATRQPRIRVHGKLTDIDGMGPLSDEELQDLLHEITPEDQWQQFEESGDLDFAYSLPGVARFRVNFLLQHRGMAAVFRIISEKTSTLEQLNTPQVIRDLVDLEQGLVLVTGPTGSGKSTTLAAIINGIN